MPSAPIRIGTRGSPLALAQAKEVQRRLASAHQLPEHELIVVEIKTSGDMIQDRPLSEVGGKGLFTKEIETALLSHMIDIAVHSMKDLETKLPDGLSIAAVLPREDARDAFVSRKFTQLADMPTGAVIGTSSLRRRAQVLSNRPDLKVVDFRGNVQTRLKKLDAGVADATFLACAGLRRLGYSELITSPIDPAEMLPAVGQGAIALQIRANDQHCASLLMPLNDPSTEVRTAVERAFLAELDGSCRTPIAGHAILDEDQIWFTGQILRPDGSESYTAKRHGMSNVACQLGIEAARELVNKAGQRLFGKT